MDLALASLIAIVVGPFVIGYWIGHPLFAGAVFVALALTVALGAVGRQDAGDEALGLAFSLLISSASAAGGGWLREKRRTRGVPRG
ncbi:MAG TPA: hypothetical protein VF587_12115 [Solirubrobacteraceae bacterium]